MEFKTDEWNIDVAVSGSQKGFMIAPGLSFLTASEKAFKMHENCKYSSFYFNWTEHKKSLAKDTTPFTPAVNLICSLHTSECHHRNVEFIICSLNRINKFLNIC